MNPDIAVWKQMSGSGIHVACVGLVFWLLVHREDEARHTKSRQTIVRTKRDEVEQETLFHVAWLLLYLPSAVAGGTEIQFQQQR